MELNENADLDTSQVEDMRGRRSSGGGTGGLGGMIPNLGSGGGKLGLGTILLLVVCLGGLLCFGGGKIGLGSLGDLGDLGGLAGGAGGGGGQAADNTNLQEKCSRTNPNRFNETDCRNLLYVNSIQNYWQAALPQYFGTAYQTATTRFFSGGVNTACGQASSGVGPFYCPGDNHVYIDLTFYDELANRFGAKGAFAQPYVLAHEYGHHIQALLGTEAQMRRAQQRDPGNANAYSVMLELQADCYAGAWAKAATQTTSATGQALFKSLTAQDLQEALDAAAAVGDDSIQQRTTGRVNESAFTHGSAQQRQQWFAKGYQTGDPRQCDTFGDAL